MGAFHVKMTCSSTMTAKIQSFAAEGKLDVSGLFGQAASLQ
jgi:hypothetical protein